MGSTSCKIVAMIGEERQNPGVLKSYPVTHGHHSTYLTLFYYSHLWTMHLSQMFSEVFRSQLLYQHFRESFLESSIEKRIFLSTFHSCPSVYNFYDIYHMKLPTLFLFIGL